jgi:hypothetical protein
VPVRARAHRGERLQPWLAAWFVTILVLAPSARPLLPLERAAAASDGAPKTAVAHDGIASKRSAAGLNSAQPVTLGILSRPSLVETTLGLPPAKSPLLRPAGHEPLLAHGGAMVPGGDPRAIFQRSAVGTARTATGPPA